jgi:type IVB pilus formation R64 PilN family outer membrane protein
MLASVDTGGGNGAGGGGGNGGASGGASSQLGVSAQKIQNTAAIKIWQDLREALEGMVGHAGTISASPATGTVTVTATADAMRTVQAYLREQNQRLSRQVMVSVKVLSVNLADSEQYGLDLSLVFQRLQSGFTANLLGPVPSLAQGFGSLNLGIVNAPSSSPLAKFNGSRAIIEALSTQGDVAAVYSNAVTTSNNKPAPFQNVNQKGYVYSSQTTQTANVGSQTSLTPGTIVTGFSLNVLPRILAANKLLLQFDLAISSLNRLDSVTVGGSFIQLPDIDTRSTLQEVALQSGATLVVTGFEQAGAQTQSSGMGSPDNILLGGQKTGSRNRQAFVVLITPEIVASPFDVAAAPARRDEAP